MTRPIPRLYVTRFFQLVTGRQFTEAERVLERIKQKMRMSERNRGYFQALYGMLLAQRSNNDKYAFLSNLNPKDKKELQTYRKEFMSHSESRLHGEYDRGFFMAWSDYMRVLSKLERASTRVREKKRRETQQARDGAKGEATLKPKEERKPEKEANIGAKREEMKPAERSGEVKPLQSTLFDF